MTLTPIDGRTDIKTPSFTGTFPSGDAGVTISLYVDGSATAAGTGAVDLAGRDTIPLSTALADGPHSIVAVATKSGDDPSDPSTATTVTVDTTLRTPAIAFAASNSAAGVADVDAARAGTAGYTVTGVDPDATATVTFTGTLKSTGDSGQIVGDGTDGSHTVDLAASRTVR